MEKLTRPRHPQSHETSLHYTLDQNVICNSISDVVVLVKNLLTSLDPDDEDITSFNGNMRFTFSVVSQLKGERMKKHQQKYQEDLQKYKEDLKDYNQMREDHLKNSLNNNKALISELFGV